MSNMLTQEQRDAIEEAWSALKDLRDRERGGIGYARYDGSECGARTNARLDILREMIK